MAFEPFLSCVFKRFSHSFQFILPSVKPQSFEIFIFSGMKLLRVYFEGCCHGRLDAIYSAIQRASSKSSGSSSAQTDAFANVDLLLIGGDFQSIRTHSDLSCIAVPPKYKSDVANGDFAAYFDGKKKAPVLTIFIGGNHEASNYLQELYYGGWVAPNIYYLGKSGAVIYKNKLRIAGVSGIYNEPHYKSPYYERVPFGMSEMRSVYHVRNYEMAKLELLSHSLKPGSTAGEANVPFSLFDSMGSIESLGNAKIPPPIDIFMSHDWPAGIEQHGNVYKLISMKPFFKDDIRKGELGSPAGMRLLKKLKPKQWLSAHLHVGFEAEVDHKKVLQEEKEQEKAVIKPEIVENEDEIVLDDLEDDLEGETKTNKDEVNSKDGKQESIPQVATNEDEIVLDDLDTELEKDNNNNEDEIDINLSAKVESKSDLVAKSITADVKQESAILGVTKFLALDKCLPKRKFVEQVPVKPNHNYLISTFNDESSDSSDSEPHVGKKRPRTPSIESIDDDSPPIPRSQRSLLMYDPEWLAIVKTMNPYFPIKGQHLPDQYDPLPVHPVTGDLITTSITSPSPDGSLSSLDQNRIWVRDNIISKRSLAIPNYDFFFPTPKEHNNKKKTASPTDENNTVESSVSESWKDYIDPDSKLLKQADSVPIVENPQTIYFCSLLSISNVVRELADAKIPDAPKKVPPQAKWDPNGYNQGGHGRGGFKNRGGNRGNNKNRGGRNYHTQPNFERSADIPSLPPKPQSVAQQPAASSLAKTEISQAKDIIPQYAAESESE